MKSGRNWARYQPFWLLSFGSGTIYFTPSWSVSDLNCLNRAFAKYKEFKHVASCVQLWHEDQLPSSRCDIVDKTFTQLECHFKSKTLVLADFLLYAKLATHPYVKTGIQTHEQPVNWDAFKVSDNLCKKNLLTEFYSAISLTITSDVTFQEMLCHVWQVELSVVKPAFALRFALVEKLEQRTWNNAMWVLTSVVRAETVEEKLRSILKKYNDSETGFLSITDFEQVMDSLSFTFSKQQVQGRSCAS